MPALPLAIVVTRNTLLLATFAASEGPAKALLDSTWAT